MQLLIEFFININTSLQILNIDLIIVMLVIAAGFFQKRYLKSFTLNSAFKTLIVGTIFTTIYMGLNCDFSSWECAKPCLMVAFISYCFATSFYEIIVKHSVTYLSNKFGNK